MSLDNLKTFVIYTPEFEVLGYLEHESGGRAVDKAEDAIGRDDLVWADWSDATQAEKMKAQRLGAIT
jgi:hypothetical protein